jgi:hypothetical protein
VTDPGAAATFGLFVLVTVIPLLRAADARRSAT